MTDRNRNIEDMSDAELEAWFAERLQQDHDQTVEDQSSERLWLGLGIMVLIVAGMLSLNAWLGTQGYGA